MRGPKCPRLAEAANADEAAAAVSATTTVLTENRRMRFRRMSTTFQVIVVRCLD
jgi:hypothetical protein